MLPEHRPGNTLMLSRHGAAALSPAKHELQQPDARPGKLLVLGDHGGQLVLELGLDLWRGVVIPELVGLILHRLLPVTGTARSSRKVPGRPCPGGASIRRKLQAEHESSLH